MWRLRLPLAAVCVAGAVSAGLRSLAPPSARTLPVVVVARDGPAGTVLAPRDLRVRRVPIALVPGGAATAAADAVGSAVAVPLAAGTPVVPGVLAPHDVAGPPGTVVAAVRFADPAIARLLSAGARVDVVAADAEGGPGRTVATRALVLPAPARTDDGAGGGLGLLGGDATDAQAPPVLLAVSPDEATALAGASASAVLAAVVVP